MASSLDFVEYVCGQIGGAGEITYKKMFGEYGVYCNGKIVGVICDNQFFVKKTEAGAAVYPDCKEASPYTGAKLHFVIDSVDDRNLMARFISATYNELPFPKPKKKKVPEKE
ncbi:TfoX/Sxy family protein [Ihubacter sp. rT4E-8]|uniref:TfoX/Sxy family protein n=1 Tax=Ihubacter sp. rT4E-8 TaxID=3242369 RepID=UPI003CF9773F